MTAAPAGSVDTPGAPRADHAPLLVTALFDAAGFAWLDGLRRRHYPPERNRVPAHCSMFRQLPPSAAEEVRHRLSAAVRTWRAPRAVITGPILLDQGVALRIDSPEMEDLRAQLAEDFTGLLPMADRDGWRPHVTIQNKVPPCEARALYHALERDLAPRAVRIAGLAAWRWRGGPWDSFSRHMFA